MLQIVCVFVLFLVLVIPTGRYVYKVASGHKTFVDPVCDRLDRFIYFICRIDKREMGWKQYAQALVLTNLVMMLAGYTILKVQAMPFLNPNTIGTMDLSLALNTIISFMTNTNLQHYAGESALSYLSQMAVITVLMFTSAATGYAASMAFIRGLAGSRQAMGNYYVDMVRCITRILLPLALFTGFLLVSQGVPQTLESNITLNTIEGTYQDIATGPVASLESIKHLGTNGGGFFGANSSTPMENPTVISNIIELLSMMLLPGSCVVVFGLTMHSRRKQGHYAVDVHSSSDIFAPDDESELWAGDDLRSRAVSKKSEGQAIIGGEGRTIFLAMLFIFLAGLAVCLIAEMSGNPILDKLGLSQATGNMEGKEMRFGITQSALFTAVTTSFTTGSVNNMHDALTPLGGMGALLLMMLNVAFGGVGVGLMNMVVYVILAVFLCGLMIGRTPEYLGKKIEGREMNLIALILISHPLLILSFSALAVITQAGLEGVSNPGFHGLSQILYEYASSAANNGSGFEGLGDNTIFWNLSTGAVMFLGRYIPIVLQLALAGSLMLKKPVGEGSGTLKTDTLGFTVILAVIVFIFAALTFLPALSLGPIAEHLILWS